MLARVLDGLGLPCDVEVIDALAILVPCGAMDVPPQHLRAAIAKAARGAGFAGVAFELTAPREAVDPTTP